MKIATWNVNSLRVRWPHLQSWLEQNRPDVVGLQETKVTDEEFPRAACEELGYHAVYTGQKSYNGVAILSRMPLADVRTGIPDFDDPQQRVIAATVGDVRVVNAYFPNGSAVGSDKYHYKLGWLARFAGYIAEELKAHEKLVLTGDFNIAPEDQDVHDPQAWEGSVLVSEEERAAFRRLVDLGLVDCFRNFPQEEKCFSWWDYRAGGFRRNLGLRIDHILCSPAMVQGCTRCYIDKEPRRLERPSDHTPVVAEFSD